jgi:NAD(P)-dependent dehydrogenase (short-subunit alcohol dehydrogenase family)
MADLPAIPPARLGGRIVLVTGASRGIGYQIALQAAAAGAHVIAVARTQGGLEELDDQTKAAAQASGSGGSVTLVPLNLMDGPGIDRLGGAIFERWGRLDVLFANAAILGVIAPVGHVEAKTFDKVMATNVTATWRLIRSVEPLLLKSDAGRAIILSSGIVHSARAFWGPYAASKAAVEALARVWADETRNTPLRVVIANPGLARTAMRAQAMPGEDPATLPAPADVAAALLPLAERSMIETGRLFDVAAGRFLDFQRPA